MVVLLDEQGKVAAGDEVDVLLFEGRCGQIEHPRGHKCPPCRSSSIRVGTGARPAAARASAWARVPTLPNCGSRRVGTCAHAVIGKL
jgi:hypothetical protein